MALQDKSLEFSQGNILLEPRTPVQKLTIQWMFWSELVW